jgi:hypothetical protein
MALTAVVVKAGLTLCSCTPSWPCRQCWQQYCDTGNHGHCAMTFGPLTEMCYEYKGLPAEQQVSIFPTSEQEDSVTFWRGFHDGVHSGRQVVSQAVFAEIDPSEDRKVTLPLQQCSDNCSFNGFCMRDRYHADRPFCECYHVSGLRPLSGASRRCTAAAAV